MLVRAIALGLMSVTIYLFSAFPYIWIFITWSIVCIAFGSCTTSLAGRVIAINAGVILLALTGIETYLAFPNAHRRATSYETRNAAGEYIDRNRPHDVYGWAAVGNQTVHWRKSFRDEIVFDVTFTIDSNGLRVSNSGGSGAAAGCLLFFGGSYTFGDGVNDFETMPYLVSAMSRVKYQVYNFGYSGYGAHNMLAALEHGIVDDLIDCEPKYVIYQGIVDHARRAADRDTPGPRYVLDRSGAAIYRGKLHVPRRRSRIARAVVDKRLWGRDVDLLVGIVDAARDQVRARYPNAKFHMIFWDKRGDAYSERIIEQVAGRSIPLHLMSDIISDLHDNVLNYTIGAHDTHPNAVAHRQIAEYVTDRIIEVD